jgi:hypothetical protein
MASDGVEFHSYRNPKLNVKFDFHLKLSCANIPHDGCTIRSFPAPSNTVNAEASSVRKFAIVGNVKLPTFSAMLLL